MDLYSYTLIDVANGEIPMDSVNVPQTGDAGQLYTAIDYNADSANQAPTADVSAVPVSGDAPLTVSFNASGSSDADGSIVSYHWNFGDGSFGSGNNVNHTYQAGQYTAVLTVTDDDGATDTASIVITVDAAANQAPTADVSAVPVSGEAPLTVSFNGSNSNDPDGQIANYHWNFGDGAVGSGNNVNHTYQAGQYTAVLTVTDDDGATDTDSVVITVEDPSALNAPSNLRAAVSRKTVTLSWSHSGDNEYNLPVPTPLPLIFALSL